MELQARHKPKFRLLGQHTGTYVWSCPECGKLTKSRLRPETYMVKCRSCQIRYVRGDRLARVPPGKHLPPPDTIIPMLDIETVLWRSGEPVSDVTEYIIPKSRRPKR